MPGIVVPAIFSQGLPRQSGVYRLFVPETDLSYVGETENLLSRARHHESAFRGYPMKTTHKFSRAIAKHGIGAFRFEILELCPVHQLRAREGYWMDKVSSTLNTMIAPPAFA